MGGFHLSVEAIFQSGKQAFVVNSSLGYVWTSEEWHPDLVLGDEQTEQLHLDAILPKGHRSHFENFSLGLQGYWKFCSTW
jgi:hypothetical protein